MCVYYEKKTVVCRDVITGLNFLERPVTCVYKAS